MRFMTLDVFTARPFGGNPLAVVLPDAAAAAGLTSARMQAIAAEFGLSETVFVLPAPEESPVPVRIFTPRAELPFAGHPTVGAACALAILGRMGATGVLETRAGPVPVRIDSAGRVPAAEVTAPVPARRLEGTADAAALAAALGLSAGAVLTGRHPPAVASAGMPFLIAELADRAALAACRPDPAALDRLYPAGAEALLVYVRASGREDATMTDQPLWAQRMFGHRLGVPEDPATGGAAAALTGLIAGLEPGIGRLALAQGAELGRPGLIRTAVLARGEAGVTVAIGGAAIPMSAGELILGDPA